ncbi:MerR family transcriptional regulator [Adhaeribacter aerolatus]|uniref:MerR family transcriptional regulator n=1 Tax=Adhaeribacter aerolatus TaxID=670289 RepID=A0A512AUU2_9BACT|nr:MerR family transcriptional regulator [Adhaeribacter aerolatus]GEO03492.1 MerR family transcriptional regulator [Adhaeribacter aerolatus]
MAQYSIRELEHLSGIKAHTIRIWEQRYGILQPKRTETNIRFYDDTDLKNILNISFLNEQGYKISRIAKMSEQAIADEVLTLTQGNIAYPQQLNGLLLAMMEMDEQKFDKLLTTAILQRGLEKTMLDIICPFLVKTGLLWQTGSINPAHEHFISNLIRQKLLVAIDGQVIPEKLTSQRFLLYLPEGELHEIGLLFSNYVIRSRGNHVMYLGQNLPFPDLEICVNFYKPHFICTAFTYMPERDKVQDYINRLACLANEIIVYLAGHQVQFEHLIFPPNIVRITSLPEFIGHIQDVSK